MCAAFDKLIAEQPSLAGKQLRLMKYDPTVEWPTGNLLLLLFPMDLLQWLIGLGLSELQCSEPG